MASDKAAQSIELLQRVNSRLMKHSPKLAVEAPDFVLMFLVCVEELEKMRRATPDPAR